MNQLIEAVERASISEAELCNSIGMNEETWRRKLNGEIEFTVSDILKLRTALSLSNRDIKLIFFDR